MYDDLVRLLKDRAGRFDYDGWVDTAAILEEAANAIEKLTAIVENYKRIIKDGVELVRCGQCKYCVEHYDTDGNAPYWTCKEWDSGTDYDGYCHYGKRKNGGQEPPKEEV